MILSDRTILQRLGSTDDVMRIGIEPFNLDALQGASYDLTLGSRILTDAYYPKGLDSSTPFLLPPQHSCLASTIETIHVPYDCVARVEGKSSIGRQFVIVHCTAGWCDPGFNGQITLEIVNLSRLWHFDLTAGMPIAQLTFLQLDQVAERVYKGKYQGDTGPHGVKL